LNISQYRLWILSPFPFPSWFILFSFLSVLFPYWLYFIVPLSLYTKHFQRHSSSSYLPDLHFFVVCFIFFCFLIIFTSCSLITSFVCLNLCTTILSAS
jgi:hypothetical protein